MFAGIPGQQRCGSPSGDLRDPRALFAHLVVHIQGSFWGSCGSLESMDDLKEEKRDPEEGELVFPATHTHTGSQIGFLFFSFLFFPILGQAHAMLKFPGQGSNLCHSSGQSHSNNNARSFKV